MPSFATECSTNFCGRLLNCHFNKLVKGAGALVDHGLLYTPSTYSCVTKLLGADEEEAEDDADELVV
jgi:hypothetical protein